MALESEIGWTDSTWNPCYGCTKVSEECLNCYMFRWAESAGIDPTVVQKSKTKFDAPIRWAAKEKPAQFDPPEWGRKVFTMSLSDFFHAGVDPHRPALWQMISATSQFTYQILTKRPERIADHLPRPSPVEYKVGRDHYRLDFDVWPWPNIWIGVSAGNQRRANERIPRLLKIPADVHFVSCEPLLGPIDFGRDGLEDIEWVIVGGESDYTDPRPMKKEWAMGILAQCEDAGVPAFFKQWGGTRRCACHGVWGCMLIDGKMVTEFPRRRT